MTREELIELLLEATDPKELKKRLKDNYYRRERAMGKPKSVFDPPVVFDSSMAFARKIYDPESGWSHQIHTGMTDKEIKRAVSASVAGNEKRARTISRQSSFYNQPNPLVKGKIVAEAPAVNMTREELIEAILEAVDSALVDKIAKARKAKKKPYFTKTELRKLDNDMMHAWSSDQQDTHIPYYANPNWSPGSRRRR